MSLEKYSKHQKSRLRKFVATDPESGDVIMSTDNRKEFREATLDRKETTRKR